MKNNKMRGQVGGALISLLVGLILIVAVIIPVTKDLTSSLTWVSGGYMIGGTAKTILDLLVPMAALLALIFVVSGMNR